MTAWALKARVACEPYTVQIEYLDLATLALLNTSSCTCPALTKHNYLRRNWHGTLRLGECLYKKAWYKRILPLFWIRIRGYIRIVSRLRGAGTVRSLFLNIWRKTECYEIDYIHTSPSGSRDKTPWLQFGFTERILYPINTPRFYRAAFISHIHSGRTQHSIQCRYHRALL